MRTAARLVSLVAACAVAACAALGLCACGPSEEEAIRDALAAELDQIAQTPTEDEMREALGGTYDELVAYGIEPSELYAALYSRFEYEMGDVSVDGDTATVTLSVTNVDVGEALSNFERYAMEWMYSEEALEIVMTQGEDAYVAAGMRLLVDALSDEGLGTVTEDVSIELRRDSDGSWRLADEDEAARALLGGVDLRSASL